MKRSLVFLCLLLLSGVVAYSQLINNGATIKIQPGAYIFCSGDVQNNSGGTISNDGKLEVQGNFTNSATYTTATADDSLIMSGSGNVILTGGASTYSYLTINKSSNANTVKLGGTFLLGVKLDYLVGTLSTDPLVNPSYLLSSPTSAVYNFAAGEEIIGSVKRTGWANGSAVVFNQPNMQVTTNTGTAPTDFTVTMIPQSGGGDPTQAEREVKRKFVFAYTGGSGFTSDIRYPYLDAELNTNTEGNLVPWNLLSSVWNGRLSPITRDGVNNYVSTTGISTTDLANEWKLADPHYTFNVTAELRGPWNGTDMNTSLNTGGIIPLGQPYNVSPFNYAGTESVGSIPNANVVDWVLIEFRMPATGLPQDASSATIIGRKAGFLLKNGTVVDLDGVTPLAFDINKQGAGFAVVRHRNHLGVLSVSLPSNATGSYTNDYSVLANSYKATGAASDPVVLLAGGTKYGLWAGDANKNGAINATDITAIKVAISNLLSGYQFTDVGMNGSINATDVTLCKLIISSLGTGSLPARMQVVRTNIPDPIGPDE